MSSKSPPVTTPVDWNQSQARPGCPPLQPMEKHCEKPQFAVVSVGDNNVVLPVAMHNLSLKASVEPNAQQLPQADWSRMSPETDAQSGQLVRTSKSVGMSHSHHRLPFQLLVAQNRSRL